MACQLHRPYELLKEDDLGFVYSGSFHDGLTARLIDLAETVLAGTNVSRAKRNKLAFVMVEAYQNIIRHKVADPILQNDPETRAAFVVRSNDRVQSLVAINAIPNVVRERIETKVKEINSMSRSELKQMFLSGLEENSISDKGGAGLGLIEMARRSGNHLGVRMVDIDDRYSMFMLAVTIGEVDNAAIEKNLDRAAEFHQMSVREDLLIMHKGELSASAVSALLPMVQRDMDESPHKASIRSRAYLAGVEVFRSLRQTKDGIFALCRNGSDYLISIGQELPSTIRTNLNEAIVEVNSMDDDQLNTSFRRALLSSEPEDKELRGLLDLAICSKQDLESDTNEETEFLGLKAVI